jgi:hypothetical protein
MGNTFQSSSVLELAIQIRKSRKKKPSHFQYPGLHHHNLKKINALLQVSRFKLFFWFFSSIHVKYTTAKKKQFEEAKDIVLCREIVIK